MKFSKDWPVHINTFKMIFKRGPEAVPLFCLIRNIKLLLTCRQTNEAPTMIRFSVKCIFQRDLCHTSKCHRYIRASFKSTERHKSVNQIIFTPAWQRRRPVAAAWWLFGLTWRAVAPINFQNIAIHLIIDIIWINWRHIVAFYWLENFKLN